MNWLLLDRRREFHRRVGLALEALYADREEEAFGLLAHHFGRASEPAKAIEYANKAGDHARELFAYREAIDYYQQTLGVLKEQEEYERAARTLMKIGLLYHTLFDFARSHQAYEEGFALWRRANEIAPAAPPPTAPHALRVAWGNPRTFTGTRETRGSNSGHNLMGGETGYTAASQSDCGDAHAL